MRTDRALTLVAALDERAAALRRVASDASDAEWTAVCAAEGWSVGLVAYHIARGFERQAGWVEAAISGAEPHRFDWAETHALNATVAETHAAPTRPEALGLLEASVDRVRVALTAANDAALSRVAFAHDGHERSLGWVIGKLMIRHADGHLASIAAALAPT